MRDGGGGLVEGEGVGGEVAWGGGSIGDGGNREGGGGGGVSGGGGGIWRGGGSIGKGGALGRVEHWDGEHYINIILFCIL